MSDLYKDKPSNMLRVTDYKYTDLLNHAHEGYVMNRILWNNVKGIPKYLEKDNSMIIIVSGSGLTRIAKSTLARQLGYAAAWCIAGGVQDDETDTVIKKPRKELGIRTYFDTVKLSNDLATTQDDYQVYILDESDEAAGSRTATSKKNKEFRDLIIRSAMKKMVLILVLPDFFMLSQHWACVNSDCLINVFTVGGKRGYFNFYDRNAKERLYYYGKKKVGADRYSAQTSWPTFNGTFPNMWPGDKEAYNKQKQESLLDLNKATRRKTTIQRDHIIRRVQEITGYTYEELSNKLEVPVDTIHAAIQRENIRLKADAEKVDNEVNADTEQTNDVLEGGIDNGEQITGETSR